MRNVWLFLSLSLTLLGCSDTLTQPVRKFEVLTPRPFGYVIGDVIVHKIIIETRPGILLQPSSLPTQGAINRWLNLNEAIITETESDGGHKYHITLNYQIFYAPLEVKMLTLPGFEMAFSMGSKSVGQTVPPWHFTVSPLRELAVRKDAGGEYMRPDAQAEAINADSTVTGFALSLSIALLSAARLASLYGFWPFFRRRNIFKQALRKLDALSADDMDQVLTTMHQALNSLNGQPVFKHRLDIFYRKYPNYRQLGRELNWFFEYSSRYFFIGTENSGNVNLEKIKKLCQNCREIERGSR